MFLILSLFLVCQNNLCDWFFFATWYRCVIQYFPLWSWLWRLILLSGRLLREAFARNIRVMNDLDFLIIDLHMSLTCNPKSGLFYLEVLSRAWGVLTVLQFSTSMHLQEPPPTDSIVPTSEMTILYSLFRRSFCSGVSASNPLWLYTMQFSPLLFTML